MSRTLPGTIPVPPSLGLRLAATASLLIAASAFGQPSPPSNSALIAEQLDKQIPSLDINGVLPAVMKQISDTTGVRIEARPDVWELLPWGEQTNITTKIQNRTLRDSLTAITRRLGLIWVLRDNSIELQPVPALARLGRRATHSELLLLNELASTPFKSEPGARLTVRQILEAIDAQLAASKSEYVIENRTPQPPASTVGETVVSVKSNASITEALEAISLATKITWYPWGKSIVALPKEDVIRGLLQKPITVRYQGMDVGQALLELSRLTNVAFAIEPGAVQRIPPEFRSVRLIVDNASVQQVLEQLSATTGVGYVVTDSGVYIWNNSPIPNGPPAGGTPAAGAGPGRTALLVPLPSGQLVIPEAEMPEDIKEYLKSQRDNAFNALREQMKKEKFTPATRPSTRPEHEDL